MIRFETKFDADKTKQLNKFTMKKFWWAYALCTVIFVALGVMDIVSSEPDLVFGIVMIVIGVLFTPLCIWITSCVQKRIDKSMSIMSENTVETYVFDEDQFSIKQEKGEEYKAITVAKYSYFHKVVSTPQYYMLYLSKMQCHVLPKESIVGGSLEELDKILNRNLHEKFVSKSK